ncbi:hypothetical protein ACWIJ6_16845 [Aeromonas piscicola]
MSISVPKNNILFKTLLIFMLIPLLRYIWSTLKPLDYSIPKCSLETRWQQPIAVQQVMDGYAKPNEAAQASIRIDTTIRKSSFFELRHQSA